MPKRFIARGKLDNFKLSGLLGYGRSITEIDAIMHEGIFGSNHRVRIILDKKFTVDLAEKLNTGQENRARKITIIIE